jgi:hypothetical protein
MSGQIATIKHEEKLPKRLSDPTTTSAAKKPPARNALPSLFAPFSFLFPSIFSLFSPLFPFFFFPPPPFSLVTLLTNGK